MDYFKKIEKSLNNDLVWNIPEQKQGTINIIGGNSQNFKTEIKITEFVGEKYPIKNVNLVLPNALKKHLPELPNFMFLKSTDSGSFADGKELAEVFNSADYNLLLGDLSKNSATKTAIASAFKNSDLKNNKDERPILITRDAVDLITDTINEKFLMNENLIFLASMPQLIKILRAVYYPKMLLLTQSFIQVVDVLHKFTLSYPAKIITLHNEQIFIAENGQVRAVPLEKTSYTPLTIWNGELAAKIVALNLYNPNNFIDATLAALFN